MNTGLILGILATSVALSAQIRGGAATTVIEGTWVVTRFGDQPVPPGVHSGLVITGDKYEGLENGQVTERGTIKVDATKKPAAIDFVIAEGTDAGKTQLGAFEMSGDAVRIALGEPGATGRPQLSDATLSITLQLFKIKPLTKDLEGVWEGSMNTLTGAVRVQVTLSNGPNGLARGVFISPDQSATEVPIHAVAVTGTHVMLIIPGIRGTYEGELKDGQITGALAQPRTTTPLVFKRKV